MYMYTFMHVYLYADLYACRGQYPDTTSSTSRVGAIPRFTAEEVKTQLGLMAKGKAGDSAGLVVEMLQSGSEALNGALAALFTDILLAECSPSAWKHSRIRVLFKKDQKQVTLRSAPPRRS